MPYELVHPITVQIKVERRVACGKFFQTIHSLLKTFHAFEPARTPRGVAFKDFIPNRIAHETPPIGLDVVGWNGTVKFARKPSLIAALRMNFVAVLRRWIFVMRTS
jgi:hypothetical protein